VAVFPERTHARPRNSVAVPPPETDAVLGAAESF